MGPAGVLLFPKPSGMTSHDVVRDVRRRFSGPRGPQGERVRVGHAGTLDPFATGLLLVLVGRATRLQRFFMALPKRYRAVARLGFTSDTGDREGRLTETGRVPSELRLPTGELLQRPPAFSAVKVGGEPLYRKARRGEAEEGAPRPVTIHRFQCLERTGDRAVLEIECSAGTYVRQLVAGLGDAYCEELERTAIGPFSLEGADPDRLVPLSEAMDFLPERALERPEARRASHGAAVPAGPNGGRETPIRLTHDGRLIAIARAEGERLRPLVVVEPA